MTTKLGEEEILRKKVWKIINLIQANQLFVHFKELSIKYLPEKLRVKNSFILNGFGIYFPYLPSYFTIIHHNLRSFYDFEGIYRVLLK